MLLWELHQEEPTSTVTHNGQTYSLNKLFYITDRFQLRAFKIKDLKWILKYSKPDPDRLKGTLSTLPILVTYSDKKLVILDGLHRLCTAIDLGLTTIDGKFVYKDVLEKCKIGGKHEN